MYNGVPVEIPVLRPRLPTVEKLVPWLARIDASRYYSNFGPLNSELEEKIARRADAGPGGAVTVTNGTLGLSLALLAEGIEHGDQTLCVMPSFTFVATACAAWQAGMIPYFIDVDPATWALDPEETLSQILKAPRPVGAVIVVAPFGVPLDPAPWDQLREQLGRPVIVDAAAGWDATRAGQGATMISLHATKGLGVGEGGVLVSRDADLIARIRSLSVFGFSDDRVAVLKGTNAKLDEYGAAVGLAGIDEWEANRAELAALKALWMAAVADLPGVSLPPGADGPWQTTTFNVVLPGPHARAVRRLLAEEGIDSRQWWGSGCHRQPAYARCPRTPLPHTERLTDATLGLPFFLGMTPAQVERAADALRRALARV